MIYEVRLPFDEGYLKVLKLNDIHPGYIQGLNDPDVNQYLEVRHKEQTFTSVTEFVRSNINSNDGLLFGIWLHGSTEHCGTLRLHSIEHVNHTAHIGICLFDKTVWGKGIGTKALKTASAWALEEFKLQWIEAGAYEENIGSQKAFIAAGYEWIYDIPNKYLFRGKPTLIKAYVLRRDNLKSSLDNTPNGFEASN